MKNITIMLPIHEMGTDYDTMFFKAIESVEEFYEDVKLNIICPPEVKEYISKTSLSDKLEYNFIINDGKTDFCSQINLGISKCDTEWFSILEIDDLYNKNWVKYVNEYINNFTDVDVFLPIVKDINSEGKFTGFTNESAWAYGFSDIQGEINNEVLLEFQNYQTSGGIYKTEKIKEIGNFKENIKLTFTYEFLLRATHNFLKVMVIPRIGYTHVVLRENSLFWNYQNIDSDKLSENEVSFWVDAAKKEFFYKNKREIVYEIE